MKDVVYCGSWKKKTDKTLDSSTMSDPVLCTGGTKARGRCKYKVNRRHDLTALVFSTQ